MSELNASNLRKEHGNEGPDLVGTTELTSPYYMVPPSGTTAERPQNPQKGTLRFNTDIGSLEYFKGNTLGWEQIVRTTPNLGGGSGSNTGTGARGVFGGGYVGGSNDQAPIDFITISTFGNGQDFGDMSAARRGYGGAGSNVRGIFAGGDGATTGNPANRMGHITYASLGDETDFGNLTTGREGVRCLSNSVRFISAGGGNPGTLNIIDYISIQGLGNAVDFGDLTRVRGGAACIASPVRGIMAVGEGASDATIDYITIMSTGDALDFGDLSQYVTSPSSGGGNATRGLIIGGFISPARINNIEYVTIATLGNAIDFGDLDQIANSAAAVSSPTRAVNGGGSNGSQLNVMNSVEIPTTGDALDFGDLDYARFSLAACSNGHGGL